MKERFANLLTVKSIMTLALTLVFCVLALCGTISGGEFLSIFTMIVGFYFGTQAQKRANEVATEKNTAQRGEAAGTVTEKTVPVPESVDSATYEKMHPSESEDADKDIIVSGFAG